MILGLDISSTMIGVAVIDSTTGDLVHCKGWDLSKIDNSYTKYEMVGSELYALRGEYKFETKAK